MNTLRFMIMAVGLCLGLCNAAALLAAPAAESVTEVLLSQCFDSETAGREPMGWFAIRTGDGHCVVTRSYAASLAQAFRIGSSPIWDGLYGYGFATPQGGVVRVEARILCDTIGAATPYLGVKLGGKFYEMVGDQGRALTRWSNGEARWSYGPALMQGVWNTVRIDIDVTRGVARYWLNGAVVLDNSVGVPAPEFARSTEAIYLGVVAGAAGVAYFDDVTICQVSQRSLPLIQPAQRVAPMRPQARPMSMQALMAGRPPMQVQKEVYVVTRDGKGTMPWGMLPCVKCKALWAKSKKPWSMLPCDKCKALWAKRNMPGAMQPRDNVKNPCGGPCMQGMPCGNKCLRAQKKMKQATDAKGPESQVPPCTAPAW